MYRKLLFLLIIIISSGIIYSNEIQIARLKYDGGGDWYNNPSVIPNLTKYFNENINEFFISDEAVITLKETSLYNFPIIYMTGHGVVKFSEMELNNLRRYLDYGGFIYIDDDYGMNKYIKPYLENLYDNKKLVRIGNDFELFNSFFEFSEIPKIHEHDGKKPELFGIFIEDRLALLYSVECNISDGWASPEVHKDPENIREKALKFGCNILYYSLNN